MKICAIDGCGGKHEAKGFCNKHYLKKLLHGDALAGRSRANNGVGSVSKSTGYVAVGVNGTIKLQHRNIVESVLGFTLPPKSEVHHIDGNRTNNSNDNLVVCPNNQYHQLIHRRMEALEACGNANFRKCSFCKKYDDPANMTIKRYGGFHNACRSKHRRDRNAINKLNTKG
jgi:hypothetical protein